LATYRNKLPYQLMACGFARNQSAAQQALRSGLRRLFLLTHQEITQTNADQSQIMLC